MKKKTLGEKHKRNKNVTNVQTAPSFQLLPVNAADITAPQYGN